MAQNKSQSSKAGSGSPPAPPAEKKKKVGPLTFLRQVRAEGGKVTWASVAETRAASIMVLIFSVIASLFLLIVDQIVGGLVRLISGI
jgi:preprotein translocase subunit SecE